jgi:hypothetical protein
MQGIIAGHQGALFVLYRSYEEGSALESLEAYGLEREAAGCRKFVPHVEPQQEHPFCFCAVLKKGAVVRPGMRYPRFSKAEARDDR